MRYIRALARATDWFMDPQNKQEAIEVFREANPDAPEEAEEFYEESVHPNFGVMPRGEVDREGIQTILEIREAMGEMEAPLPTPDKYVEESYLRKALASLGDR